MALEISLTPNGQLVPCKNAFAEGLTDSTLNKCLAAFSSNQAAGLFALAAAKSTGLLTPSAVYWREFACLYLTELCKTPESSSNGLETIEPLAQQQLEKLIAGAPPMTGAEYLQLNTLQNLWTDLNEWVSSSVKSAGGNLSSWLKEQAPLWHQVGRVCFHLAENKQDSQYPFAFLATYAPQISQAGRVQYQPLSSALKEYAGEGNKKVLINLLSPINLASEKSIFIKELLQSNEVFHPLVWTANEAYRFLKDVPIFEESGILVRLPDWWQKRPRPKVAVTIGEKKQSLLGLETLLDFNVELILGDSKLTADELKQIQAAQEGLIYLKGQWIEINEQLLSQALAHWKKIEKEVSAGGISFIEGMRLLSGAPIDSNTDITTLSQNNEWSFVNAGEWLSGILSGLRNPSGLVQTNLSKNFCGTLRPYQKTGHDWLWFLSNLGLGACLADDMGLGKTVQVLSLLLSIKEQKKTPVKPSLLVLPASLLANWKTEIERFAPALTTCFIHPWQKTADDLKALAEQPKQSLANYDLVITTYGMLLRQEWLQNIDWRLIILDEAQAIKNPGANQTRTVKKLHGETRIALTGTPVENRLSELWSLFDFLSPGLLGSVTGFKNFIKKLDALEHNRYAPLRNLISPYILRRLKTDKSIIADLPDKTEMKVFCGLSKQQTVIYSQLVDELSRALKTVEGIKRRGLVLSFLLKFKQVCNHPSQLLNDGRYDATESGKFERLRTIADEIASRQEKVLVFTQFREITDAIANFLADIFGRPGLLLHGGTPVARRKNIVDSFQQIDGPPFVVLTIKAGGTGLNLTAASHVIHFDRWWNPAVENQATDRAYRIGQHRNVLVHKFVCPGTIEEKIDQMIQEKKELADNILTAGAESILTELSDKELLDIVSLNIERINIE